LVGDNLHALDRFLHFGVCVFGLFAP
jgi:hypothetical protein